MNALLIFALLSFFSIAYSHSFTGTYNLVQATHNGKRLRGRGVEATMTIKKEQPLKNKQLLKNRQSSQQAYSIGINVVNGMWGSVIFVPHKSHGSTERGTIDVIEGFFTTKIGIEEPQVASKLEDLIMDVLGQGAKYVFDGSRITFGGGANSVTFAKA